MIRKRSSRLVYRFATTNRQSSLLFIRADYPLRALSPRLCSGYRLRPFAHRKGVLRRQRSGRIRSGPAGAILVGERHHVPAGTGFCPSSQCRARAQQRHVRLPSRASRLSEPFLGKFYLHRFNDLFKGKLGNFSYSLDNAFLYVDGNKLAETYALNQLSGAAANQGDKYRNNFTHAVPRERRNQYQDRYTAQGRWDLANGLLFLRPYSNLTYYNLNTYLFNTSKAPYLGYQDYIDRWDINGGADVGVNVASNFALTVGYRDGYQHQDPFALAINSDQHYSSNHYQRVLFGFEGQVTKWLSVKFDGGPDFRDFNPNAPIIHDRTTRYYGEGSATATLSKNQSLNFTYKQWIFVSSTGLVPYDDISYALTYHLNVTPRLGLDLGARYLEANYTLGDDVAGSAPSLRDDIEYEGSVGFNYLIVPHLTANVTYVYDKGANGLATLPANLDPAYRDFEHGVVAFSLKYSF